MMLAPASSATCTPSSQAKAPSHLSVLGSSPSERTKTRVRVIEGDGCAGLASHGTFRP